MKILLILSLATLAYSAKLSINRDRTLADDFKDIKTLIPQRKLTDLIRRYLTGDAEFQRIILYFGSPDVTKAIELIERQPEISEFYRWLKQQLLVGSLDSFSDESNSSDEFYNLLTFKPDKQKKLRGWKGFMDELLAIYPRKEISNLIREKAAAKGIFAEFWNRVTGLRPVYERILKFEDIQKVIVRLRTLGVDTKQLDQIIREDYGWKIGGAIGEKKILGNILQNINNQSSELNKAPLIPVA